MKSFTPNQSVEVSEDPPTGWVPFNSHILIPPEANAGVRAIVAREAYRILATEGMKAFEMPKSAALAHEVGHAIVGTSLGLKIVEVRVREISPGIWSGRADETSPWRLDIDSPIETILTRARFLIGGIAGETMLDPDNLRSGSSIDEIVISQVICAGVWQERRAEFGDVAHPSDLWTSIWRQTCGIIGSNKAVATDLIRKLERNKGRLRGKPLAPSFRRVERFFLRNPGNGGISLVPAT